MTFTYVFSLQKVMNCEVYIGSSHVHIMNSEVYIEVQWEVCYKLWQLFRGSVSSYIRFPLSFTQFLWL